MVERGVVLGGPDASAVEQYAWPSYQFSPSTVTSASSTLGMALAVHDYGFFGFQRGVIVSRSDQLGLPA